MIIRSKAPLRLGLAGGGSDVSPYSDMYGGLILNATINLYSYCTIQQTNNQKIELVASDLELSCVYDLDNKLPIDGRLDLLKGVFNRLVKDYNIEPRSCKITTFSDAPPGSGLGTSSTMVVAIVKAFVEWYHLPLGEYDMAHLAFEIERIDLGLSGGKQDQYAAAFGGFNFMEFLKEDRVIVNPLRIKRWIVDELESSMLLYFTGKSRSSSKIIEDQRESALKNRTEKVEAMHRIKHSAIEMKEAILKGDINRIAEVLRTAWEHKKKMADSITNHEINEVMDAALQNGAMAGKVSGAGGGGFIIFILDPVKKVQLKKTLECFSGKVMDFHFSEGGCHGWKIYS